MTQLTRVQVMPHTEASDPETSWKSAAKETAPWSQSGRLQEFTVCLDCGNCEWNGGFLPCTSGLAVPTAAESGLWWAHGAELLKSLKYFYSYKKLLFSCFTNT